jgi:eukaryotic-like serine/threonine-protein kinase
MTQAAAALPSSELVLGRYRPLRPLGSGGSGSVWLARDERSGLDVALKIVKREGKAGTRAEREAAAAAALRHPRCLRAYGFARDSQHVYIAYEYVPGRTLRELMRAGELGDEAAVEAAAQILEGLAHAHANGVVHRDVKPSNVLVSESEAVEVRLLDFGLARMREADTLTGTGDVPGTLAYISPERLAGDPGSAASDVWGVGVMLWEALAGFHPFWQGSLLDTAKAIEAGAPPLATVRPDLPTRLAETVDAALSLSTVRRPSAARLAIALRDHGRLRRRRRSRAPRPPRPALLRLGTAALAAAAAGAVTYALPFWPAGWWLGFAALAGATTAYRERLGLALTLLAPLLPLGNVSLGLALLYSAGAAAWLAACWREPRVGFMPALGPLLAPLAALALLPLAFRRVGSPALRAAGAAAAVLTAAAAAAVRHAPLPFTGARVPAANGLAGAEGPLTAARSLWHVVAAHPGLAVEAAVLAAAAALLPLVGSRGLWWISGLGAAMLAAALLAVPAAPALPLVLAVWLTCGVAALTPAARL